MGETQVVSGMTEVVTNLTGANGLNADTFFGVIADLTPFIKLMVPIGLGLYFLRRLVNGAGKAKVKF